MYKSGNKFSSFQTAFAFRNDELTLGKRVRLIKEAFVIDLDRYSQCFRIPINYRMLPPFVRVPGNPLKLSNFRALTSNTTRMYYLFFVNELGIVSTHAPYPLAQS